MVPRYIGSLTSWSRHDGQACFLMSYNAFLLVLREPLRWDLRRPRNGRLVKLQAGSTSLTSAKRVAV